MGNEVSGALSDGDLARLLCTRLCHDLAGPLGAVSNGAELLAADPSFATEAAALLSASAASAAQRLKVLRAAFGLGGERAADGGGLKSLLEAYFAAVSARGAEIALTWVVADGDAAGAEPLLLNMCLLAAEALPRGGVLAVETRGAAVIVSASGRGAKLRDDLARAAGLDAEGLTPRSVQAFWAARLASDGGRRLVVETAVADVVTIVAVPR